MGLESSSLTFPSSPVIGQTEDFQGKTWEWNGLGWRRVVPTFQSTPFVLPAAKQWIALTAAFTLISQTAAQNIFPTGGLVLSSNRTYLFECAAHLAVLSSTSGSYGFALAGTATLTRQKWSSYGVNKIATVTSQDNASSVTHGNVGANLTLTSASTAVNGGFLIKGILRVGTGGTIIPQVSQATAATPSVGQDSYFWVEPIGLDTQQSSDT